jgi:hypothetical protein
LYHGRGGSDGRTTYRAVLRGSRTAQGDVDFDALLSFGDAFRKARRALARGKAERPTVQPVASLDADFERIPGVESVTAHGDVVQTV